METKEVKRTLRKTKDKKQGGEWKKKRNEFQHARTPSGDVQRNSSQRLIQSKANVQTRKPFLAKGKTRENGGTRRYALLLRGVSKCPFHPSLGVSYNWGVKIKMLMTTSLFSRPFTDEAKI